MNQQDVTSRTRPHRRVERILDRMKIGYDSEYTEFTPWALDLWLGEWHAAIEVDGPGHGRAKDARRDADLLERYGVKVLRVPTDVSAEQLEVSVLAFIRHCAPSTAARRAVWRESQGFPQLRGQGRQNRAERPGNGGSE